MTIVDNYYGSGSRFLKNFRKYGSGNFKVEIIKFAKDDDELNRLEEEYILDEDLINPLCLNWVTGGMQGKGYTNPKTYVKTYMFDLSGKLQMVFDSVSKAVIFLNEETKEQCVQPAIIRCMSGIRRTYKNHLWSYTPDPPKIRSWKRMVYVFDMNGKRAGRFVSCMEAARWIKKDRNLDISVDSISAGISACCNNTTKSYLGLRFSYDENPNELTVPEKHSTKRRAVLMIDPETGTEKMRFDSMTKAARYFGNPKNSSHICQVLKSKAKRKTAFGYFWKYADPL